MSTHTPTWIFAALGAAGVLLAWIGATTRPFVRVVPADRRGILAQLDARLQAGDVPLSAREFLLTGLGIGLALGGGALVALGPTILSAVVILVGPVVYWQIWAARQERYRATTSRRWTARSRRCSAPTAPTPTSTPRCRRPRPTCSNRCGGTFCRW